MQRAEAIRVQGLGKSYGSLQAVQPLSFSVGKGELFGLIGPDGAGKTTLLRMLATLLLPDRGQAQVCGLDVVSDYKQLRALLGYMPGRFSLYQDLSIEENIRFFATVFGTTLEENYELVRDIYVQIEPFRKRRAGQLSGGMKQKLALCCALIHRPEVLLLDEPTTGVDPVSRREFWDMLDRLKAQGIAILVSTPYMDEATRCDRIGLMQGGRLLSVDTPRGVMQSYPRPLYAVSGADLYALQQTLRGYAGTHSCYSFGECLHLSLRAQGPQAEADCRAFLQASGLPYAWRPIAAGVEDCFMEQGFTQND